ncbi:MAG: vWA domain-containing protein [Pseudomonadota bacterium]
MRRFSARRFSVLFGLSGALVAAASCSAGGNADRSGGRLGVGGSTGAPAAGSGNINTNPNGATGNIIAPDTGGGSNASDAGCQHVEVNFVPKIPTVFVLVDRSDSMFTPNAQQVVTWEPLKAGVLDVVKQLEGQIRFGFGAFTGQQGGMCPIFESIAPALNNSAAISAVYQPLGRVTGAAGETPVMLALPLVKALLDQPGNDGDKYILFVTDGEPDFCDNGDSKCPIDAVVGGVQQLAVQGVHTLVFGLGSSIITQSGDFLQALANAGASLTPATPFGAMTKEQDVCYACQGVAPWSALWPTSAPHDCATVGKQTLGSYGTAATNATVYHPDPADQAALTAQIASVISGIKSCTFDLGGNISVNLSLLDQASVSIEGTQIPLAQDNGWRMNSETQVELVGSACATWNDPKNTHIDFNFPCDIIVVK